jgi:hypothetical protein
MRCLGEVDRLVFEVGKMTMDFGYAQQTCKSGN